MAFPPPLTIGPDPEICPECHHLTGKCEHVFDIPRLFRGQPVTDMVGFTGRPTTLWFFRHLYTQPKSILLVELSYIALSDMCMLTK